MRRIYRDLFIQLSLAELPLNQPQNLLEKQLLRFHFDHFHGFHFSLSRLTVTGSFVFIR